MHEEGKDPEHHKQWQSRIPRGEDIPTYRIIWRDEVFGVAVSPGFQVSYHDGQRWQLLTGKTLKRTHNAAKTLCEEHRVGWLESASRRLRAASRPVVLTGRGKPDEEDVVTTDDASTPSSPTSPSAPMSPTSSAAP